MANISGKSESPFGDGSEMISTELNEQPMMETKANGRVKENKNMQKIRDKAMKFKSNLMEDFEKHLNECMESFVEEVEALEQADGTNGFSQVNNRSGAELAEKIFLERRSVLTDLLEISHIRTIYHIFVAILIVFMLNTLVYDIMDQGRLVLDFDLIVWCFGKFPIVITLWVCMYLCTSLVVYISFQYWAYSRKPGRKYWYDYMWLSAYICYQLAFLVLPLRVVTRYQLPPASCVVVVSEQVRLLMKSHAFVRENIPKACSYDKHKKEDQVMPCPDYSKYLYFLFAPTLVYRDAYPRNQRPIRWNYVVSNFLQVLACMFYIYYIFERFCVPVFRNFNSDHITPRRLIISIFGSIMPGTLVLFIGFFAILHSWLNAFAEMLRFADRLFYKDWWNSSTFSSYYRTWNVVVHDWLYTYVYKDFYKICGVPNRAVAMASVFLLSAMFHEYILIVAFGFFYPVLFVLFQGAGFALLFVPNKSSRSGNVFMWVALFIGNGMLMCLYSMEWYARKNCPSNSDSFVDYLIPRSWACNFTGIQQTTAAKTEL